MAEGEGGVVVPCKWRGRAHEVPLTAFGPLRTFGSLRQIRDAAPMPIASLESLIGREYTGDQFRPHDDR